MCAIPTRYPLGFDEPLVVDLDDEVGRPVALSESAGADNGLKFRRWSWRMFSRKLSRSEGDRQAGRVLSGLAWVLIRSSVPVAQ